MEATRSKAGQLLLRVGHDRIALSDVRPPAGVDVQRQEPARLSCSGLEIAVPRYDHPGRAALLGHADLGAAPVTLDAEG